jgi:hypothetical protein
VKISFTPLSLALGLLAGQVSKKLEPADRRWPGAERPEKE